MSNMWNTLGTVPPSELMEPRLEAHHAVQWVARATRAYCQPESDDSHTSLSWDSSVQALMGQALTTDLTLGLRLADLTLLVQSDRGNESYSLIGKTEGAVGEWVADLVSRNNLDPLKLKEPGPYTLSSHRLDSGGVYGTAEKSGVEELAKYYHNAALLLDTIHASYPEASPVRCWPHFFDIATILTFEQKSTSDKATIGVGCSPGDATYSEPYFYVSLWPYPPQESLPPVIAPAFWHLEGFTAIILRSGDLVSKKNVEPQQMLSKTLIEQGVKESVEFLTQ
ncbi:hypothetical protein [Candidatus Nitrospira salsa]